jgi:hypothetical protein
MQMQFITAHHTARRVQHHVVTNGRAFGVEALQDPQRPFMAIVRAGVAVRMAVVQRQLRLPTHLRRYRCGQKLRCSWASSS